MFIVTAISPNDDARIERMDELEDKAGRCADYAATLISDTEVDDNWEVSTISEAQALRARLETVAETTVRWREK
jgi:hypothetical protein